MRKGVERKLENSDNSHVQLIPMVTKKAKEIQMTDII